MLSISIINWFIIHDRRKENDILFQIAWFAEDTYESVCILVFSIHEKCIHSEAKT